MHWTTSSQVRSKECGGSIIETGSESDRLAHIKVRQQVAAS
ncbi:hypothetical protein ACFV2H_07120 [Streptomyces sp. NPDC059629]